MRYMQFNLNYSCTRNCSILNTKMNVFIYISNFMIENTNYILYTSKVGNLYENRRF